MKQLSREAFERARKFLKSKARPVERALFEYRFEGTASELVLSELAAFQNTDGGFGRALEPDMRTPSSSALATAIGLEMLKDIRCPANHLMAQRAAGWLQKNYRQDTKTWRAVPPDTNKFPHAPWWHDENGSLEQTFDAFKIIPRALIVGMLHHFSAANPPNWLDEVTEDTIRYIESLDVLGSGGGSDIEYAIHLAETENLPENYRNRLKIKIRASLPMVVSQDPQEWETYCITPLKVVPSPQSLGADLIQEALQTHLDYEIEHQSPEGPWNPVWTWGDPAPDAWRQARVEWQGHLTFKTLAALDAFGRIII